MNNMINEVIVGAKNAAKTVGKKASEFVDVSKLRITSTELNNEISKRYEALGRVVYDSKKEGTDVEGLVLECVKSIDALYARLDDNNEQIAKMTNKKNCKNCGSINTNDAVFCSKCGTRMPQQEEDN